MTSDRSSYFFTQAATREHLRLAELLTIFHILYFRPFSLYVKMVFLFLKPLFRWFWSFACYNFSENAFSLSRIFHLPRAAKTKNYDTSELGKYEGVNTWIRASKQAECVLTQRKLSNHPANHPDFPGRGISPNGRAPALHAGGNRIDTQILHFFFLPFELNVFAELCIERKKKSINISKWMIQ